MTASALAAKSSPSAGHSLWRLVTGRAGYVILLLVFGGLLAIGSTTKSVSSDTARIAHLESIIRCPSCEDLSIAESETESAQGLRTQVNAMVHQGYSDQAIEAKVEGEFPGTLLEPTGDDGKIAFLVPVVLLGLGAILLVGFLVRRRRVGPSAEAKDRQRVEDALMEGEGR